MAEKMIRCPEGHFYDTSKHNGCPWCALPADTGDAGSKTRPVRLGAVDLSFPPPLPAAAPAPAVSAAPGVTRRIGMDSGPAKVDPVVGWLVCIEGPDRGRDVRLHAEKNFIGRASHMDVCLSLDDSVSREKHGLVIFDPKKQVFWTLPGDSSGLVYLNGEIVHGPTQLKRDDVLELGQSKLALIPFCGEKYSWAAAPAVPSA